MTMDQRIMIEKGLDQGRSLRSIALQLGKDPTTISKEIKKHRSFQEHNHFNESKNKYALIKDCKKKNICGIYAPVCKRMCKLCNHCNSHCDDFTPHSYHCPKLDKAPFVCNACAAGNVDAGWTKLITGPRSLIGNTGQFWLNPDPVSTFLPKI